ncbi:MAG TPA: phenylalanine--tRNA ligase subunit beta [Coriobacteriia bacterium]|jgi:phenylalanyl-tRNA synthetase beta chain
MRVSMKWLRELVPVDLTPTELADRLDLTGTAVEGIETVGQEIEGVVIGRVAAKERHPDAEKLWVTTVDVGAAEPLQIVCGAQNFEVGDKVPVATVGTTLPNGVTIKKAKLRGVESHGMNCSAIELGVGGDASGLLVLPEEAPVGASFAEWRGMSDSVLDLEITPNRPDCLSIAGIAREVAAVTGATATKPSSTPAESGTAASEEVSVTIEDADLCPRYTARLIRGVHVGPSPDWLVEKLLASGARPVSNIVDITNFVMFELGQPLHAFDAAKLGREDARIAITVRVARESEDLVTLDGKDRRLAPDTLVIADPSGAVALAGVMGGETTEVSRETVDVLLESACFDPASVSRTSRRLGLFSEASSRFEKGVDPNGCVAAADRAAALIAEIAGGQVAPGVVDAYPAPRSPLELTLRVDRANAVLGTDLGPHEMADILGRLGLGVADAGDSLAVEVPTFRPDLTREIDLIEEVVRVHGMQDVASTLPAGPGRVGGLTRDQRLSEQVGEAMRAAGLDDTMTYSFADPADFGRLGWELAGGEVPVELLNPMSEEQALLRWTLAPGLLRAVSHNQRRGVDDVHLYEIGTVFHTAPGRKQPKERTHLGGALAGMWHRPSWDDRPPQLDFFDGKGVIEALMESLGIHRWKLRAAEAAWLQPGRCAEVLVGGETIGWLGEVAAGTLEAYEARGPVVLFELRLGPLVSAVPGVRTFGEIPRFPAVELDLALLVPEDVTAERVEQTIGSAGGKMLERVRLFDVYRGAGVPAGRKSLAFALTYRSADRTLTDDEVAAVHEKVVRKVTSAVGGELRT